ncbi:MAG: hypothetical protein R2850_03780 [Bacteroidia bacterium]
MQRPDKLNPHLFWDVNEQELDYELHSSWIIERVFERGDVDDIRQVRRFYGDERVKEALTNARWLSPSTITLAMAMFNNKFEDYRCYILAQSNPTHFSY